MKHIVTVTQEGVTASQPGVNCSVTSFNGTCTLNVRRLYPNLCNDFGGRGVFKRLDADGILFPSADAAFAFARDRGYVRPYFKARTTVRRKG